MNKQAITFFSLFSLILVLSVYYMMIPPIDHVDSNLSTNEETLQDKLQSKHENEKQTQNDILASSVSTSQEVNDALNDMDETNTNITLETKVKNELTNKGYSNVFCEIDENVIKITIKKEKATSDEVVDIMECVDSICNQKYMPEIKFIDE